MRSIRVSTPFILLISEFRRFRYLVVLKARSLLTPRPISPLACHRLEMGDGICLRISSASSEGLKTKLSGPSEHKPGSKRRMRDCCRTKDALAVWTFHACKMSRGIYSDGIFSSAFSSCSCIPHEAFFQHWGIFWSLDDPIRA